MTRHCVRNRISLFFNPKPKLMEVTSMKALKTLSILNVILALSVLSAGMAAGQSQENSTPWMTMESGSSAFFKSIRGNSPSDIFVAGGEYDYGTMQYCGVILRFDGTGWNTAHRGVFQDFNSLWGSSGSNLFVVGGGYDDGMSRYAGVILHYDGTDWTDMHANAFMPLNDVWGSSDRDVVAVGDAGTILRFDGTAWHEMDSGTDRNLRGVWGASASEIFAVGEAGTILRSDGTGWSLMTSGTERYLEDVRGSSGSDVYAVGDAGTILHFDGAEWREMIAGTDADLRSVWVSSDSEVYAAGDAGTILHYNGTGWHEMNSGTTQRLRNVWGLSQAGPADIFAVGDYGTILRYLPLTLEVPESVSEGDGTLAGQGVVQSVYAPDSDLTIHLISEDDSEISVPATVAIPAGQISVLFDLTVTDDTLPDGSPKISVTASAPGYSSVTAPVRVIDNEAAVLAVTLPETAAEGDDTLQGTVFVSPAVEKDVSVSLISDDTGEVIVPENVTIPLGQTSAVFDLMIGDDAEIHGIKTATVTASVAGWTSGSDTIDVEDNESRELSIHFDTDMVSEEDGLLSVSEHDGVLAGAGIISVPGAVVSDLMVHLSSDTPSEIIVPETVTIPSGEASANFDLTVTEDSEIDGSQTVAITGHADGWTSGSSSIDVHDNDPGTLIFSAADYEALESNGSVFITVVRELSATGRISVSYATSDDTATADEDYTRASGVLVFEDGEESKTFSVPISDDTLPEGDETLKLLLGNPKGGARAGDPAFLTIIDDELTCLNANIDAEGSIALNWCEPIKTEGLQGYNLYQEGMRVNTDLITETVYAAAPEAEYGNYAYTVRAVYETGEESGSSNETSVLIAPDYALSYDGEDDYAGISDLSDLECVADQSFTVELWIKVPTSPDDLQASPPRPFVIPD